MYGSLVSLSLDRLTATDSPSRSTTVRQAVVVLAVCVGLAAQAWLLQHASAHTAPVSPAPVASVPTYGAAASSDTSVPDVQAVLAGGQDEPVAAAAPTF